jgi:hypothetical protein
MMQRTHCRGVEFIVLILEEPLELGVGGIADEDCAVGTLKHEHASGGDG